MGTILIVEDYPATLKVFEAVFRGGSHAVKKATTFQEVQDFLEGLEAPLVALIDENFPGGNGAQVAQLLRENIPGVKLISTSSKEDEEITWKPDARFRKPISSLGDLLLRVGEFMMVQYSPLEN